MDGLVDVIGLSLAGTFLASLIVQWLIPGRRAQAIIVVAVIPCVLSLIAFRPPLALYPYLFGLGLVGSAAGAGAAIGARAILTRQRH